MAANDTRTLNDTPSDPALPGDELPETPPDAARDPVLHTTLCLLRDYRDGDNSAFTRLYDRHAPAVRRSIARRFGLPLQELVGIDDVLQETFVAAWRYLDEGKLTSVRTIGGFQNCLVKIAIHRIQDMARHTRRLRRQQSRTVPLSDVEHELVATSDRPSQIARSKELGEIGEAVFLELPEEDRLILDCRDKLSMSYRELAEELGCKAANAKLRYFRAKERFRARLEPRLGG